jgi:adenylosuccinate lyase
MIDRYSLPEMNRIWTEENRFRRMLDVEIAVVEAMAEKGIVPKASAANIKKKASFKVSEIHEIEKVTKHDVTAFLKSVGKSIGPDARFVHMGITSSDVLDTAVSLQIVQSLDMILVRTKTLQATVKKLALKHKLTPAMGRTHGVHAEPTTFGLKVLLYYPELGRAIGRLENARKTISVGKISGAVGTYAGLSPALEKSALGRLGLAAAPISTQVLQRDRHAEVMSALAILAATLEKCAVEIRHLQRTEVREVEESFSEGQTGSSAMPHKKNPVNCERVTGLARLVRSNLMAALENVALWHERDISHSSVERVIFPDSFLAVDFMLSEMDRILANLKVYPDRMMATIKGNRGLTFSQRLLTASIKKGLARFDAYAIVQRIALQVWNAPAASGDTMESLARSDERLKKLFTDKEFKTIFDLNAYLEHVDAIFKKALK